MHRVRDGDDRNESAATSPPPGTIERRIDWELLPQNAGSTTVRRLEFPEIPPPGSPSATLFMAQGRKDPRQTTFPIRVACSKIRTLASSRA